MPVQQSKESEKQVSQHSERCLFLVTYDSQDHSSQVLPPSPKCGHDEDENGHGNGGDGQCELGLVSLHNDHELHCESKEEEEVEFE
jgi:hypothetical protein